MQDETRKKGNNCGVLTNFLVIAMVVTVLWVLVQDFIIEVGR